MVEIGAAAAAYDRDRRQLVDDLEVAGGESGLVAAVQLGRLK
jgi:hypothetical protein